jgi:CheY-like chemotaxis protein
LLRRVLVAEDDGLVALAIADVLIALGAERIELCARADDAIEIIAQLRPTLLILDLGLADCGADRSDGWAVAELARDLASPSPAIIFATVAPERVPRHLARRGQVLRKPFTEQVMIAGVLSAGRPRGLLARLWDRLAG